MAGTVMKVKEWVKVFDLKKDFCEDHGTRLDFDAPSGPEKKRARFEAPSDGVNESNEKECIDCKMAMRHPPHLRCEHCDNFAAKRPYGFNHCDGCKKDACTRCMPDADMSYCIRCEKDYCDDCAKQEIFRCHGCDAAYCSECRDFDYCFSCHEKCCGECRKTDEGTTMCRLCSEEYAIF